MSANFHQIMADVVDWAWKNAGDDIRYGSPSRWWRKAREANFITEEQLNEARVYYGMMWYYTGD